MVNNIPFHSLLRAMNRQPQAWAAIHGSSAHPAIRGCVYFYQLESGVLSAAQLNGLPGSTEDSPHRIFAFHIHSGGNCGGTEADPFADALGHYNPNNSPHPYHAGDMPPLFGNGGYAFQMFFTDRFSVREIVGRTVIIHSGPDDFISQPGGNAGEKIACGEIKPFRRQ